VRKVAVTVLMIAAGASGVAAERSAGVFIFTGPDGSRRVVNVPAASGTVYDVPQALEMRRQSLWPTVENAARANGLDPALVDLVIRMESGYNPRAVSRAGAVGVMQLMPATAALYGVVDSFNASENIRGGVSYLRDLLARFGADVKLALAAYNAGPEAVDRHGGVPPYEETRNYVRAILGAYQGVKPAVTLSGGFGRAKVGSISRRKAPARPVTLVASNGAALISNSLRSGEMLPVRRLGLD